jgi:hypothetical protein
VTKNEVERSIFEDISPTKSIQLGDISLIFNINEDPFPEIMLDWVDYLSDCTSITLDTPIKQFLLSIPYALFEKLINYYTEFFNEWSIDIHKHMKDIINEYTSKSYWRICSKAGINNVLKFNKRLNYAQNIWVLYNDSEDLKEKNKLIFDTFEVLQPWLNYDLWKSIDDKDKNTRVNKLYDQQISQFEGNNDLDEITIR